MNYYTFYYIQNIVVVPFGTYTGEISDDLFISKNGVVIRYKRHNIFTILLLHCLDGPAYEVPNSNYKEYYINGVQYSKVEFYLEKIKEKYV